MCGIVGRLNFNTQTVDPEEIKLMCEVISHRGPDNQGIYVKGPVGLGNRRLSIIDLSPLGNQPISNEDKTVWITLNGEIYNFQQLRKELLQKGHKFRSKTDTEVIVHLWEEYGENCLKHLRGMFALALWDDKQKVLMLARDRMGQKPLKYYVDEKKLIFASELKAILKTKGFKTEPDLKAIDHYFGLESVPVPLTGFKGIKKLPPASYLMIDRGKIKVKKYWQLKFLPKHRLPMRELKTEVLQLLAESVKLRLVADVPVGAFLSGGVDSSAVVALMSRLGHKDLNTFSVGFKEQEYSELKYARLIAKKFKTNHHEAILNPQDFSLLPKLARAYEEPYGDISALPTYLISKLASKKLKVVLNGDGGDDIFAGYQRYQKFIILNFLAHLGITRLQKIIKTVLYFPWRFQPEVKAVLEDMLTQPGLGQYAAAYLTLQAPISFKKQFYTKDFFNQVDPLASQKLILKQKRKDLVPLDNVLLTDLNIYLSQTLLPKVDIASMAWGLEVRSPFLDQKLVEFVNQVQPNLKLRRGEGKYILKKSLEGILPKEIIYRKKMGFGFPLGQWFKNQWQDQVKDLLLKKSAKLRDYLNQEKIKEMIESPLEHEHIYRRLWRVLMFELWLQAYF